MALLSDWLQSDTFFTASIFWRRCSSRPWSLGFGCGERNKTLGRIKDEVAWLSPGGGVGYPQPRLWP
jgi:hypothetical protein